MTDQEQTTAGAEPAKPESNDRIPVLWFDSRGCGPDLLALELQPFKAEMDGKIPASLGLRVRAGGLVIGAGPLVGGGFNLGREQVEHLHRQLGAWLALNGEPAATSDAPNDSRPSIAELRRIAVSMTRAPWTTPRGARFLGAVSAIIDGVERQVAASAGQAPQFDDVPDVGKALAANAEGIAALRNAAPVLLEIAEAALAAEETGLAYRESGWLSADNPLYKPHAEAERAFRTALAKVRP